MGPFFPAKTRFSEYAFLACFESRHGVNATTVEMIRDRSERAVTSTTISATRGRVMAGCAGSASTQRAQAGLRQGSAQLRKQSGWQFAGYIDWVVAESPTGHLSSCTAAGQVGGGEPRLKEPARQARRTDPRALARISNRNFRRMDDYFCFPGGNRPGHDAHPPVVNPERETRVALAGLSPNCWHRWPWDSMRAA